MSEPTNTPDLHDAVTHRKAWMTIFDLAIKYAGCDADKSYFAHEKKALDNLLATISAIQPTTAPAVTVNADAMSVLESKIIHGHDLASDVMGGLVGTGDTFVRYADAASILSAIQPTAPDARVEALKIADDEAIKHFSRAASAHKDGDFDTQSDELKLRDVATTIYRNILALIAQPSPPPDAPTVQEAAKVLLEAHDQTDAGCNGTRLRMKVSWAMHEARGGDPFVAALRALQNTPAAPTVQDPTNGAGILKRLKEACNGTPAKIQWPHRLLHDAIAEIEECHRNIGIKADWINATLDDMAAIQPTAPDTRNDALREAARKIISDTENTLNGLSANEAEICERTILALIDQPSPPPAAPTVQEAKAGGKS